MKKSSFIFLIIILLIGSLAQAEKSTGSESLYSPEIEYSDALKHRTAQKLENKPEYVKVYFKSALTLLRAEKATQFALRDLDNKIRIIEQKMFVKISKAGKLLDGTPIFLSKKGEHHYYAINGRPVPLAEIPKITLPKDMSYWEDYHSLYKQRQKYLDKKSEAIKY
ncbi:MAG: hypothetical protein KZQ64_01950 [gamma proteobacterium symbiont of Bathyaustriella thionipta]|nr:hypothetical protein [gamma proteobacterium symbiont of Bathyaustriella thionipta]MCU7950841.1 hypothetical protein [gamma proteobacterium symbiont of Bathyaustriella thionipta]MCU7952154.1 hypothetical protein [gamma proteobacterium symbiont of Bathyaustriella thionipta]MCU7957353.1 hypothetical protein [gamma proteobacterium symbiont of Bathyaustriella thionipta]MCU7967278.1 hypothetical protein [gamma proteobacterium symbiont of Bathyaustriella thionipta]